MYPRAAVAVANGEGCLANAAAAAAAAAAGNVARALRCIAAPRNAVAIQYTLTLIRTILRGHLNSYVF